MTGDQSVQLIMAIGFLLLVGSALIARRPSFGQLLRMVAAWVAIFALVFLLFLFRSDFSHFAGAVRDRADPAAGETVGGTMRVRLSDDGHFWVRGEVNGISTRFLIDSGATMTALSDQAASAAHVDNDADAATMHIETANGMIAARAARIDISVGPITRRHLRAIVAPEFGTMNVLGMNFLSTLSSWSVEDDVLTLKP